MDWQMLGAIGELVGAGGVIATLLYLSRQIRGANALAFDMRQQEMFDRTDGFLESIASSAQISGMWRRGLAADASLTGDETVQFRTILLRWAYLVQRIHQMNRAGQLDDWVLGGGTASWRFIVSSPGFRQWYPTRREWLEPAFCAMVEDLMLQESTPRAVGPDSPGGAAARGTI